MSPGGGVELEQLTHRVELELPTDPVAGDDRPAGVTGQVEVVLRGWEGAVEAVGRAQLVAVLENPGGGEGDGFVEQGQGLKDADGEAGVGLVPQPHVPVVVVLAVFGPFG